jgi:hypothetical protein
MYPLSIAAWAGTNYSSCNEQRQQGETSLKAFIARVLAGFVILLSMVGTAEAQFTNLVGGGTLPIGSGPLCGGIVNGKFQAACKGVAAAFVSDVKYSCPAGSFFDANGKCYSCPANYARTADAVTSDRACAKADPTVKGGEVAATFGGPLCKAPNGSWSFKDGSLGGSCWSCPNGYERSVFSVDDNLNRACRLPGKMGYAAPTQAWKGTSDLAACQSHVQRYGPSGMGEVFYDGWTGYAGCWVCPAGYKRSTNAIYEKNGAMACYQNSPEAWSKATMLGKAQCKAGEIEDPRNGGECWSCPAGTTRSVYPVHEGRGCSVWGGYVYAKATETANSVLGCGTGLGSNTGETFFDAITSKDPNVQAAIRKQNGGTLPQGIGQSVGGTCWKCPAGYKRMDGSSPVYGAQACGSLTMVWKSAPYAHPGLFGLDGGEEVALALVKDGALINQLADAAVPKLAATSAEARKKVWDEIARTPQTSGPLLLAVLIRIKASATDPAHASAAEKRLAASFSNAVVSFRTYLAKEALGAYHAWYDVTQAQKSANKGGASKTGASLATTVGGDVDLTVPPDYAQVTRDALAASVHVGAAGAGIAGFLAMTTENVTQAIFPSVIAFKDLLAGGATVSSITAGAGAGSLIASVGPQIAIAVAIELIVQVFQLAVEAKEAGPKLQANLLSAQQPYDLARLMRTADGGDEITSYWTTATSGTNRAPNNLGAFSAAVASAAGR